MLAPRPWQHSANAVSPAALDACLSELLAAYYDPARGFAGATFDTMGASPRNEITRDDLLAVTLLDLRWSP